MSDLNQDVRKDKRKPVNVAIEFKTKSKSVAAATVAALTENLSTGGMFVATRKPLNISDKTFFNFMTSSKPMHFNLEGEVVWNNGRGIKGYRRDLPAGMGIKFLDSRILNKNAIRDFINFIEESTFQICP